MSWLVVLTPLLYLWIFWGFYVLIMGLYRAYLTGRLSLLSKILGAPFFIVGYLMDVLCQMTIASLLFMELPAELLVTTRLTRHLRDGSGWRYDFASWVCQHLLDPLDPSGKHCK
jgi:hypothetical protein